MIYQRQRESAVLCRRVLRKRLAVERLEDRRLLSAAPAGGDAAMGFEPVAYAVVGSDWGNFRLAGEVAWSAADGNLFSIMPWTGDAGLIDIGIAPSDSGLLGIGQLAEQGMELRDEGGWITFGADSAFQASSAATADWSLHSGAALSLESQSLQQSAEDSSALGQSSLHVQSDALRAADTMVEQAEATERAETLSGSVPARLHQSGSTPIAPGELGGDAEGGLIDVTRVVRTTVYPASTATADARPTGDRSPREPISHESFEDAAEDAKLIVPSRARSQAFEVASAEGAPDRTAAPAAMDGAVVPARLAAVIRTVNAVRTAPASLPAQESVPPAGNDVPAADKPVPLSGEKVSQAGAEADADIARNTAGGDAIESVLASVAPDASATRCDTFRDDRPRLMTLPLMAVGFVLYHVFAQYRVAPHEDRPRRNDR